jgi:ribosome-associated toxin RatA of RatAB toxin-antitoxin module
MAFETVATEAVLYGYFRKENAWNIISDYSRYPQIMDNVDKVEITERNGEEGLSQWFISVEDAPLTWVEKDYFNSAKYEIIFKSIEGDFDNINGHWTIRDSVDSGIHIRFEIQYNLGIPVIEEVLGHILHEKMKSNIEKMMTAIKRELNAKADNERRHERHPIGSSQVGRINGRPIKPFLINLSSGGMMTQFLPGISGECTLSFGALDLDIKAVYSSEPQNRSHLLFRRPLEATMLKTLLSRFTLASGRFRPSATGPQEALVFGNDQEVPIRLIDLTRDGLSFFVEGSSVPAMETFTVGNTAFPIKEVIRDEGRHTVQIRFSDHLSDDQFLWMREKIKAATA